MSSSSDIDKFKFNGSNYLAFREKLADFLYLNDLEPMKSTKYSQNNSSKKRANSPFVCWCCGSSEDPKHECKKKLCFVCGKLGCQPALFPDKFVKNARQYSEKKISMMAIGHVKLATVGHAFYLDSACPHHISSDLSILFDYVELDSPELLETSKTGIYLKLIGKGNHRYDHLVEIQAVFYSPDTKANLFSNSIFDDKKAITTIKNCQVTLETSKQQVFMRGVRCGPLYLMAMT